MQAKVVGVVEDIICTSFFQGNIELSIQFKFFILVDLEILRIFVKNCFYGVPGWFSRLSTDS